MRKSQRQIQSAPRIAIEILGLVESVSCRIDVRFEKRKEPCPSDRTLETIPELRKRWISDNREWTFVAVSNSVVIRCNVAIFTTHVERTVDLSGQLSNLSVLLPDMIE